MNQRSHDKIEEQQNEVSKNLKIQQKKENQISLEEEQQSQLFNKRKDDNVNSLNDNERNKQVKLNESMNQLSHVQQQNQETKSYQNSQINEQKQPSQECQNVEIHETEKVIKVQNKDNNQDKIKLPHESSNIIQNNSKEQPKQDYQYLSYVSSSSTNNNSNVAEFSSQRFDNSQKVARPSKVLLVMVQNPQDEVIEHRVIFEKFTQYGEVEQILIFSKNLIWKIFVDMNSIESSSRAKAALENTCLFVNGFELKMRIQYSNSQTLVLKNGNAGINYKDLHQKFEKTQLSFSLKIDPSTQTQSQNLLHPSQINFRNSAQLGAAQSMQLPQSQYNQLSMNAIQSGINFQAGIVGQKPHSMSTNLISQDQSKFIQQQVQQLAPIGTPASIIQQPQIFTNKDSQQMNTSQGQNQNNINMTGSSHLQKGNLMSVSFNQQDQNQTLKSPYSTEMKSSGSGNMSQQQQYSNGSVISNNTNSQSPMTGLKQLDKLLKQTQGSDSSNEEEIALSDEEVDDDISYPKDQQNNLQQQQTNISNQQFTQTRQMNQRTNQMNSFRSNNNQTTNNISNQGQVVGIGQQTSSSGFVGQYQTSNSCNLYQQTSHPFSTQMMQNQQLSGYSTNQKVLQSAQVPSSQQFNDASQSAQLSNQSRNGFQYMSSQVTSSGRLQEEHMGTFHGSTYIKQGFLEDSKPSHVIYVNHLNHKDITVNHLYNVFSNFGDIVKIILKRQKSTSFIEYAQQEHATKAKEYMDKKIFFENEIRVFYSHFDTLQKQDDSNQEQFIGNEQTNRFQKDSKMILNPPSLVLHISNLKQEICDHEKMHELFSQFGKIEAIHIEKVHPRYMCHLKFSALKESLMAIAHMHNKEINGRKMLISFTRKKLDQSIKNLITYSKNLQDTNRQY